MFAVDGWASNLALSGLGPLIAEMGEVHHVKQTWEISPEMSMELIIGGGREVDKLGSMPQSCGEVW